LFKALFWANGSDGAWVLCQRQKSQNSFPAYFSCENIGLGLKNKIIDEIYRNGRKKSTKTATGASSPMSEVAFDIEGRLAILTSARIIIIEGRSLEVNPIRDR